jgi:hypothetical protein
MGWIVTLTAPPLLLSLFTLLAGVSDARADTVPPPAQAPAARQQDVVIWPTLTPAGDDAAGVGIHRPTSADPQLAARAQELDATLRDAAQDLGYTLDLGDPGPSPTRTRDADMIARAGRTRTGSPSGSGTWVASARLERVAADVFLLRVVAVPPNGAELRVRVDTVKGSDVPVRGLVMLRDLLSPQTAAQADASFREQNRVDTSTQAGVATPTRSQGRAVLAVNGAVFGGFAAYSILHASGCTSGTTSTCPTVLYPLLALGTGVGLGSALLVAEEWDVTLGDAWYLAAGAWWGVASGAFVADGVSNLKFGDGYSWGVVGGLSGLTLATVALTRKNVDEGGAALAHSGGALGLAMGGLIEFSAKGSTTTTPFMGAGIGSLVGIVGAGTTALFVPVAASRVLLVDLGAGLGGLAGAAGGSPLLVDKTVTGARTQGFVAATLGGMLVGGGTAWFLTRDTGKKTAGLPLDLTPIAGVIGQSEVRARGPGVSPGAIGTVPAYGVGVAGRF